MQGQNLSGRERVMGDHDMIVSKTNLKGIITYGNDIFCEIADYTMKEVMGKPHNMVRNPEMPSCVFKLLWDTIQAGQEIFAYVVNRGKNGDHYWVLAHVTPSFDENGKVVGYHSNRRKPSDAALRTIKDLYKKLLQEESRHSSRREATLAGVALLNQILNEKGMSYEEFVLSL